MKLLLQSTVILLLLVSCSGRKQVERNLNRGNYDRAIHDALNRLRTNKEAKRKQDFIALLGDAFIKAERRDLDNISHLKKDGNPVHLPTIYQTYLKLDARQESIKPVLPLIYRGKSLALRFTNYENQIIEYKTKATDFLYAKGLKLLTNDDKHTLREAFNSFKYIDEINPNFKNVKELMDEAYSRGTEYVLVSIKNESFQLIPQRLENDLLNFDSYGLDNFWTVYHSIPEPQIKYDYALQLLFNRINISPERIVERQILRENEIVDGKDFQYDDRGNVMKDSLGNDIKIDRIVKVKARVTEFEQLKSTQILANVDYINGHDNTIIKSYPIESEFLFSNIYVTYRGDKRALSIEDKELLRNRQVLFPSNEQMVFDTAEDLKAKLREIITRHRFN